MLTCEKMNTTTGMFSSALRSNEEVEVIFCNSFLYYATCSRIIDLDIMNNWH